MELRGRELEYTFSTRRSTTGIPRRHRSRKESHRGHRHRAGEAEGGRPGDDGYDVETGEGVESLTKRDQVLCHLLEAYGVDLPNLQKDTIERGLEDPDLPDGLKELLRMRLQASTTSTSKYKALLRGVSSDGRMRGTIQFNGAGRTGRAAGRTFQPQNLPRPDMEPETLTSPSRC